MGIRVDEADPLHVCLPCCGMVPEAEMQAYYARGKALRQETSRFFL